MSYDTTSIDRTEQKQDYDWLHLTDDETVLWSGRPSLYTIAPGLLAGLVLAVVGLALTVAVALSVAWLPAPLTGLPAWTPLVLVVGGALYAGSEYLLLTQTRYVLTTEEVYRKDGLLRQNVSKIRHDRIQNTACDQSLVERLFSFGDITIYTAGTDTMEIRLTDVPRPQTVNGLLTEALDEAATQSSRRV